MKIRCIAIDDEPLALKQIGDYINQTPFLELVGLCNNSVSALELLRDNNIDLMFADISMPDLSGLDLVKSLQEKPLVVFTTAFSEYAVEGFRVDARDYLLKPFGYAEFLRSANKIKQHFDLVKPGKEEPASEMDHLYVKSGYKLVRMELKNIKYIESMHEYIRFHLANQKPVMTLASMKSIEEMLPSAKFIRVHRSFIVNTDWIKVIERNRIIFEDSVYIPVSDQYKSRFMDFLNRNSLE